MMERSKQRANCMGSFLDSSQNASLGSLSKVLNPAAARWAIDSRLITQNDWPGGFLCPTPSSASELGRIESEMLKFVRQAVRSVEAELHDEEEQRRLLLESGRRIDSAEVLHVDTKISQRQVETTRLARSLELESLNDPQKGELAAYKISLLALGKALRIGLIVCFCGGEPMCQ